MKTSIEAFTGNGWINAQDCGASGSEFQSVGEIRAGSNEILIEDIGDFRVGQEVTVSHCHLHYYGTIYNALEPYYARNQSPLGDELEFRGLNADKAWQTFIMHFEKTEPVTFNWMAVDPKFQTKISHDPVLRREWDWQGKSLSVNGKWFSLADGVEARFKKLDWQAGQSVAFHARNRLLATIKDIRGKTLILSKTATNDASVAMVRHHDQTALRTALELSIKEKKGLFIPAGRYRLSEGLWMRNSSVHVEGASRENTTLDISEDHTAVFWIAGGKEVVIRNLGMLGHTGFLELPAHRSFTSATGFAFWPTANQQMEIKGCAAANFVGTEHLLFEDLKVSRMASEAFYSHGSDRHGMPPYIQAPHEGMPELNKQYTKSCVFHRCHVSDCGFNAFNNNDAADNTSILHCHVEHTANFCENASRFTRIIGNYCLDGCATSVHGGGGVIADPHIVGSPQAIIADNVFEGGTFLGGISVGNSATQVIISNNIFNGFSKECAIMILGGRRVIVTGNHIDMTRIGDNPDNDRCGITVEASNISIADNQIYVRGERSEKVTGIHVADHAVNISIHDNLVENCHCGFRAGARVYVKGSFQYHHTESEVVALIGTRAFRDKALPFLCDTISPYRGWSLRWLKSSNEGKVSIIECYDPKERTITLTEDIVMEAGDRFAVYPRYANWQIHNNTVTDCKNPMVVKLDGREGIHVKDNVISPEEGSEN